MKRCSKSLFTVLVLFLSAGHWIHAETAPPQAYSGGDSTVFDSSRNAFTLAVRNMKEERRAAFFTGNSFFNENWVAAPASTKGRDGLGPLFIARSCSACHFKDGRDHPPAEGELSRTLVFRLSMPGKDIAMGGPLPDARYGGQLQTRSLSGVKPEADVRMHWDVVEGQFADGERYQLRSPRYVFTNAAYGEFSCNLLLSVRVAPAMIGLGLLEAVPLETLKALADASRQNPDGISGRLNLVWDHAARRQVAGRFGWKAEQPGIRQQVAGAFNDDMGLTTSLFSQENYTEYQPECAKMPKGGSPEVSDEILAAVVLYSQFLAVPARRAVDDPEVQRGEKLFTKIGCASCHVATLKTGLDAAFAELSNQTIHPYTDLLLHDMGPGLADGRPVFVATGSEWRTPPLWGIGLVQTVNGHTEFLHDGRARNLAEAILWHGGEGEISRSRFLQLTKGERTALLRFLQSL